MGRAGGPGGHGRACLLRWRSRTFTCDHSSQINDDDVDFEGLWHGLYYSDDHVETATSRCFGDGRALGVAEMACAIIDEIDGGDSGYTLLFTDEDGATYQVSAADHINLGPDATGLDSLARRIPALSACPLVVAPIED